ncbi:cell wall anchor protein [Micromonospora sp. NPDC000207]|uniref:cell wall anchor protein n=1 Tax=Micromonospora sp. NPDC000207 TaxID=3154246 RepID=UPI00332B8359
MPHVRPLHRLLVWLGVATLAVGVATPAAAAPEPAPTFDLYANSVFLAPDGPQRHIDLTVLGDRPLQNVTVTVERGGVDGFAQVSALPDSSCNSVGTVLTCTVSNIEEPSPTLLTLGASPRNTAEVGRRGELVFTVTESGGRRHTLRSTVTVGEGVDLVASGPVELTGRPGVTLPTPLTVTNRGDRAVEQLVLYFVGNHGLAPAKRYRNCEYATRGPRWTTPVMFVCTFDRGLAPGETVGVADDFGFTVPRDAWAPNTQEGTARWLTPADWAALRERTEPVTTIGEKGTDGVLGLTAVDRSRLRATGGEQTDVVPGNDTTEIVLTVEGDQRADAAAKGARVTAGVGRTVPITVGITNKGPAALNTMGPGGQYTMFHLAVPEGTTVVEAPKSCVDADIQDEDPGGPGARNYHCNYLGVISAGQEGALVFKLRIDRAGRHTGNVRLLREDRNPDNDVAKVTVDATGGDGGNDGGDGGDDGGVGGGLPITGAPATTIVGVGLLLVLSGAGAFLATRRRRPGT